MLHCPFDVLISRNLGRGDGSSKQAFNETVLRNYFPDFEKHIATLPDEIKDKTVILDSSGTIEGIQQRLLENTLNLINEKSLSIEGGPSGAER